MGRDIYSELEAEKSRLKSILLQEEQFISEEIKEKIKVGLVIGGGALLAGGAAMLIANLLSSDEEEDGSEQTPLPTAVQTFAVPVPQVATQQTEENGAIHPLFKEAKNQILSFLLAAAKAELIEFLHELDKEEEDYEEEEVNE